MNAVLSVMFAVFVVRPIRNEVLVEAIEMFEIVWAAPNEALPTGDSITFVPAPPRVVRLVIVLNDGLFN